MTTFGDRLAAAMAVRGITVAQMAAAVGAAEVTIYKLLENERLPSYSLLRRLSQALGISLDALTGTGEILSGQVCGTCGGHLHYSNGSWVCATCSADTDFRSAEALWRSEQRYKNMLVAKRGGSKTSGRKRKAKKRLRLRKSPQDLGTLY